MHGFFNRILHVNLTDEAFYYEELPDSLLRETLGGKGLGTHLLLRENPAGVDPFDEAARLIIAVGPITGTKVWSQSRFGVYAKSPATGGYGESYCGGSLAPKIKGCAIDALVIKGRAPGLTALIIDPNGVTFANVPHLAGCDTFAAEEAVLAAAPTGAGAMTIGPAGENLVACACIKSDKYRSVGRGGMGAVMGSKLLKALAFTGDARAGLADEGLLKQVNKIVAGTAKESPVTVKYRTRGTPMQVAVANHNKCFPTRYWQSGYFEKWENISSDYMLEHCEVSVEPCPNCFLQCTKHTRIMHGPHAGLELEGPEYETLYAIGGLNEIDSFEEICRLNVLCDKLGIDTMSAGNLSAFAVEAYKAGKSCLAIDYNQPDRVASLFEDIAHRRGVGDTLAQGIKVAARELDMEDHAVHVKGLEPAGFDPRVLKGMGLSYATAARGACHLRGTFYKAELSGQIEKHQLEGKAQLLIDYEDRAALFDSLVLCRFFRDFILWDELAMLIEGSTGLHYTRQELERIANAITMQSR
ncbi:MAG: aldehyde:ferredoxin oxidoreductase, partial [Chitinivibrionales bacterium]|nr:aldehyde:ferredoxin oxidoreductase [Chitinivibrionales bacterium]